MINQNCLNKTSTVLDVTLILCTEKKNTSKGFHFLLMRQCISSAVQNNRIQNQLNRELDPNIPHVFRFIILIIVWSKFKYTFIIKENEQHDPENT